MCNSIELCIFTHLKRANTSRAVPRRDKNDKVDAERIASYAYRNQDSVKLWQPTRQKIKELKTLTALRTRLINAKKQLKSSLQEGGEFLDKALQKKMQQPPWRGALNAH